MFISQKKNSVFLLIFFLTACYHFAPLEPVAKVNDNFKTDYGRELNKAKKKHQKSIANYDGSVSIEKTAYGRLKQNRLDFIESNAKNNPYFIDEKAGGEVKYLSSNNGPYINPDSDIFADIEIPQDDFKYYNIGKKDYNELSNIELQNSYDYLYIANQERLRQIEIERLKKEDLQQQEKKEEDIIKKSKSGFQNLVDKVKSLLK